MAMIPDSVRPYWDFLAKYHFWLLAPLVPALVLPTLMMTNGKLSAEMASKRSEIDGKISALKQIEGISPHPNDTWTTEIDKRTARVKRETFAEWQRFWDSQADLQTWPAELGPDFIQRLSSLRPGRELQRQLLERYQSSVREMVKKLPARMGADAAMIDPDLPVAEGGPEGQQAGPPGGMAMMMNRMMQPGGGVPGMGGRRSNALVEWNPADQQRLYDSFHWDKIPTTKQMLLAQEELRVYGLLCDQIAAVNSGAGGTYNAAIPHVEQLAVGYPACEDEPAFSTAGRMYEPGKEPMAGSRGGPGGMMGGMMGSMMPSGSGDTDAAGGGGGGQVKPQHPRFMPKEGQSGMTRGMSMPPMGGGDSEATGAAAAQGPDTTPEAFMTWIYVDADGKPLKGDEVATAPAALMTHLMPFTIRATIDQRKLDAFLVQLATSAVPIDIRQIRLNPPAAMVAMPGAGGMGGMGGGPPMGGMMGPSGGGGGRPPAGGPSGGGMSGPPNRGMMSRPPMGGGGEDNAIPGMAGMGSMVRPHDIVLEIRGTIALATPPNPEALGLAAEGSDTAVGADAADQGEPVPADEAPAAPAAEPAPAAPADAGEPAAADAPAEPPPAADAAAPPGDAAAPAVDPPAPAGDAAPPADQPPPAEPA
jgi:hypothetical protein